MGPDGELAPLDDASPEAAVAAVQEAEVEAVAVCLLFAFAHPEHERRVGEALREALPEVYVSLSSEVLPEFREYERFSTTTADAYLAPRLAAYLGRLAERIEESGGPPPLIMQSSGGVTSVDDAISTPLAVSSRALREASSARPWAPSAVSRTSLPSTWAVRARMSPRSWPAKPRRPRRRWSQAFP